MLAFWCPQGHHFRSTFHYFTVFSRKGRSFVFAHLYSVLAWFPGFGTSQNWKKTEKRLSENHRLFGLQKSTCQNRSCLMILEPFWGSFLSSRATQNGGINFQLYLMGYALCRRPPIIAHCFRIADFWHCCKRILVFWDANLSFGMIGGFTLASWGPWADFGKLGSVTKETLRSRPGFLQIFGGF